MKRGITLEQFADICKKFNITYQYWRNKNLLLLRLPNGNERIFKIPIPDVIQSKNTLAGIQQFININGIQVRLTT